KFAQAFGKPSTRASEVEDSLWGRAAQHLEQDGVRRALTFLEVVLVARGNPAVCAESHPIQAVGNNITDDRACVLHSIHVADLVAVIGRDRDLNDALTTIEELDDDLSVKIESVRVVHERKLREGRDVVCPVAAMEFTQVRLEHRILDTREDAVA